MEKTKEMTVANSDLFAGKALTYEANGEMVTIDKGTVARMLISGGGKCTDEEMVGFMLKCKMQGLNPFLNDAYLIKYGTQKADMITSKEAILKRASSEPNYNGYEAGVILWDGQNQKVVKTEGSFTIPGMQIIGGWAKVYRKDIEHPFVAEVNLAEYNTNKSTWVKMTATMIRKVALMQALREAFPVQLGALYSSEEGDALNEAKQQEKAAQVQVQVQQPIKANTKFSEPEPETVEAEVVEETEKKTVRTKAESAELTEEEFESLKRNVQETHTSISLDEAVKVFKANKKACKDKRAVEWMKEYLDFNQENI